MDNSPILFAIDQRRDNVDNQRDRGKYNDKMKWNSANLNSKGRDPFLLFFNSKKLFTTQSRASRSSIFSSTRGSLAR